MNFYKYESLGNDFIVFDWLDKSEEELSILLQTKTWSHFVQKLCQRHFGIGSDGILILKQKNTLPECLMFNPDGSNGEKCLNGIRCVVQYLFDQEKMDSAFKMIMGKQVIACQRLEDQRIQITVDQIQYLKAIQLDALGLTGHVVNVGNPHFVILKEIPTKWLLDHGATIENHAAFPHRTNVEFLWEIEKTNGMRTFQLLIHERGCGFTLACGSGAAASMKTLFQLKIIEANEKVYLKMPGGLLETYQNSNDDIIQIGNAVHVCQGEIKNGK